MKDLFYLGRTNVDKIYSVLMAFCWCLNLKFYLIPVFNRLGFSDPHNDVPLFLAFSSLLCISCWKDQFKVRYIFLYLSFVFIYLGSTIIYPQTTAFVYDESYDQVMIQAMPFLFLGLIFRYEKCSNAIHLFSLVAIVCNIIYFYLTTQKNGYDKELEEEQMNAAYWLLPALLITIYYALDKRKLLDIALAIIGTFLLLAMGTRGPIVIFVLFMASYYIFFTNSSHPKLTKSLAAIVALVFYWFSDMIALALMGISSSLGLSTRVFESMAGGQMADINESSGRDEIYTEHLNYIISHNPFGGFGFGSDSRLTIGDHYSHNIIVEMFFTFGFLVGGLILAALFYLTYKVFKSCHNREEKIFLMTMFFTGFMSVFFSSRFIWNPHFYMMIGVFIASINYNKQKILQ